MAIKPPLITSIQDQFSTDALGELQLWLSQNPPTIPISLISGFKAFAASYQSIVTPDATASNTYTDLANVGPTMTLPPGSYVFIYGYLFSADSGATTGAMSLSYGGSAPLDSDAAYAPANTLAVPSVKASIATLSGSSNVVKAMYHVAGGLSSTFSSRWLISLKYA